MLAEDQNTSPLLRYGSRGDDDTILMDYWRILMRWRKLIGCIVVISFIGSLIISLLLPKIYASTTSLLPPQQEGTLQSGMAAAQFAGTLGVLGGGFLGMKSPADLWIGILKSETIRDAVIVRFNLVEVFGVKTLEEARNVLIQRVKITKSKEDIISITVEDKDPKRAAGLATAFVEELDKFNKNIVMTSGGRMRAFVEKRLTEAQEGLSRTEEAVKDFQNKNSAVKLDDQSKAIIEAIGTLKGQLMAKEVELQTFLSYATPNNPRSEILKAEIGELRQGLREMEEGKRGNHPSPKSIFIPTARIPDLLLQYARLLRDAKIQLTLYELMTQQYEMARIQEAKDSPTVQVLDVAKVSEKKIKPKRKQIVLLSIFSSMFISVILAFLLEFAGKTKAKQANDERDLSLKKVG